MALSPSVMSYIIVSCLILFFSAIMVISLTTNPHVFIIIFTLYIAACSGFTYAVFFMNSSVFKKNDTRVILAKYMSLFNAIFAFLAIIITISIINQRSRVQGYLGRGTTSLSAVGI